MGQEIELKLQLTAKTARQLARHPLLATLPATRGELLNTYYDTPGLDLTARRVAMRFRKRGWQWLLTVKSAEPAAGGLAMRSEWEVPATPGQLDFSHVDAPELRSFLENHAANLKPIFTTHFQRRTWEVEYGDSLIELALDKGEVESQGRREPICEVELELLNGRLTDLFGLTRALQADLDLRPAVASKAERGYALFHGEVRQPVKARSPSLLPDEAPIPAFQRIVLTCLEHYQRNEEGLPDAGDPEYVHQARVALRRLRSAMKLFAPALPRAFVQRWNPVWRELSAVLGEVRNCDVFVGETLPPLHRAFPGHTDIERLQRYGRRRQRQARTALARYLDGPALPRHIVDFLADVLHLPEESKPVDLARFAGKQLKKREKRTLKLAGQHDRLDHTERHALRIEIKKLRYAIDFFTPLLPAPRLKAYQRSLGGLQERLGALNDQITAETLILDCLGHRRPGPAHGWLAGRHALLLEDLPALLRQWRQQSLPRPD